MAHNNIFVNTTFDEVKTNGTPGHKRVFWRQGGCYGDTVSCDWAHCRHCPYPRFELRWRFQGIYQDTVLIALFEGNILFDLKYESWRVNSWILKKRWHLHEANIQVPFDSLYTQCLISNRFTIKYLYNSPRKSHFSSLTWNTRSVNCILLGL